jgi:hypothetical protein
MKQVEITSITRKDKGKKLSSISYYNLSHFFFLDKMEALFFFLSIAPININGKVKVNMLPIQIL